MTAKNIGVFDLKTNQVMPLPFPVDQLEWISTDAILISSSAANSDYRGVWLMRRDGTKERLTNQPVDGSAARGQATVPILAGGYFVSGGDLWACEPGTSKTRQLTHDGKLLPLLRYLR